MSSAPIVLFGAFDRHNLGDLLLGQAAARRAAPRPCLFAGLKATDLRAHGGFPVERLADLQAAWPARFGAAPLELIHVGGEILDTDAWEAAVMLLEPGAAADIVRRLDADASGRAAWAADFLGFATPAPYVADRRRLPPRSQVEFRAVGGVGLWRRDDDFAAAVAGALGQADRVTVRDRRTQAALASQGVAAELTPDPVTGLGDWLREITAGPATLTDAYIAVQCAATFGDDESLAALAARLDEFGRTVVLFRAGAATWHDDLAVYGRLAARLQVPARIFPGLHVRDLCSLISRAEGCIASSLHTLLVAGLGGVPALGLERRPGEGEKLRAYAETWGGFTVAPLGDEGVGWRSQLRL